MTAVQLYSWHPSFISIGGDLNLVDCPGYISRTRLACAGPLTLDNDVCEIVSSAKIPAPQFCSTLERSTPRLPEVGDYDAGICCCQPGHTFSRGFRPILNASTHLCSR